MIAVFIKELRENLKWAGVIAGVLLVIVYRQIRSPVAMQLFELSKGTLLFYAPLAGLVMGIVQSVFETKPDNWAFVVHRPVPRLKIFIAKCAAGLMLVYVALLIPCLLETAWVAKPGNLAVPFQWRMVGPFLMDIINAGCFYFAGIVLTLRRARWHGSRVLPVCTAIACSFVTFGLIGALWQAVLFSTGVQIICAIAAWGVFASNGVVDGSRLTRAALGAMLYAGGFGICVTLAGVTQLFTSNSQWQYYRMDRDGQVVRVTQTIGENDRRFAFADARGNAIAKYENVDLGDPAYADTFVRFASFIADERIVPWPLDVMYSAIGYRSANPGVVRLNAIAPPNVKLNFNAMYDLPERIIRLYDPVTHMQIGTVGPAGFAQRNDAPTDRFPPDPLNVSQQGNRHVMPFTSIAYWIELNQRRVRPIFHASADDPIFSAAEIGPATDPIALVATRSRLHVLKPSGTELFSAPLPIEQRSMYFNAAVLPDNHHLVLCAGFIPGMGEPRTWFLEFAPDGSMLHQIDPPALASAPSKRIETAAFAFAIPPAALPFFPRWFFDEMVDIRTREFANVFNISLTIAASISGILTLLIAWRCRFSAAKTAFWTILALLLGPAGVIVLLSLIDWPAHETCQACGKKRLIARCDCTQCGQSYPAPAMDGREIFEPADAFQPA